MSLKPYETLNMEALILAWRKAKVDLYYSTNPPLFKMDEYEANLLDNLESLQSRLNGHDESWIKKADFLGSWTLAPRSIQVKKPDQSAGKNADACIDTNTVIYADPQAAWEQQLSLQGADAEFRLMSDCSIDFHVLSALWLMKVGDLFDQQLSSNIYGSRLRRTGKNELNDMALGSFQPYLKPYRDWRDGALNTMQAGLDAGKDLLALTADVSSFYHELNPDFMLDTDFLTRTNIELGAQQKLHRLFITALLAWAQNTPLRKGLPVGLPASAVVANAALFQLDQFIEQQLVPLYYGRYVDDILLVMENTSGIRSNAEFWQWVISDKNGQQLLQNTDNTIWFKPDYLKNDKIVFENSKNKLFVLSGNSGRAMVAAIRQQVHQRTSEWRQLPELPENHASIASTLLKATNHRGEQADNLRKTDAITMHRADFALNLRDYEAYERDLPPHTWQAQRHAFFDAVITHLLTPVAFFELSQYIPRILKLATTCEDFAYLAAMLEKIQTLTKTVMTECRHIIKACDVVSAKVKTYLPNHWQTSLLGHFQESIVSALPNPLSKTGRRDWDAHIGTRWFDEYSYDLYLSGQRQQPANRLNDLQTLQARLFSHDLAHTPLRFSGLPKEMVCQRGIPNRKQVSAAAWQPVDIPKFGNAIHRLSQYFQPAFVNGVPPGLYFSTRPFSLSELNILLPDPFTGEGLKSQTDIIQALRGFKPEHSNMPHWDKYQRTLIIPQQPASPPTAKYTIAVSSWQTSNTSFNAAVMGEVDPGVRQRYQRLNRLLNELISRPDGASYLILPELAIPPCWFMRTSAKLNARRISLIAGVEYLHASNKRVRNQVWAALTHDGLGFPSLMLYRQDKQTPALHEEEELLRLHNLCLKPAKAWKTPPVIQHGDLYFAVLICSELTNIHNRAALRGKIDALFVPEWNSDTESFNALVESAALDIHAYIVQCNNRLYGDSRIRAPYKERWKRDLLRAKGGNHDYCITGEIDVQTLRQFQSIYRSPETPFKPVPEGFKNDHAFSRRSLYKGKKT